MQSSKPWYRAIEEWLDGRGKLGEKGGRDVDRWYEELGKEAGVVVVVVMPSDEYVNMMMMVVVDMQHDDWDEHCVGGGYRLDPGQVVYVKQLGLSEEARIVGIG